MADTQSITPHPHPGMARLCRSQAVDLLTLQCEIQTLLITAEFARQFLIDGLETLPEDFFSCIEELKEVLESVDYKSIAFEKQSLSLKRKKRRLAAKAIRQNNSSPVHQSEVHH